MLFINMNCHVTSEKYTKVIIYGRTFCFSESHIYFIYVYLL